jgi:hypothetical protein
MSNRTAARFAWIVCVLVITTAVAIAISDIAAEPTIFGVGEALLGLAWSAAFAVTGALVVSNRPRNMVGWLLLLEATITFVVPIGDYFDSLIQAPTDPSWLTLIGLWIYGWAWLWYIFPVLFIPLFFPTGRLLSTRWRWVVGLGLGLCALFLFFASFSQEFVPGNVNWPTPAPNPIGFLSLDSFPYQFWFPGLLVFIVLSVVSLIVRYRRAGAVEREQMRWLLFAAALFAGVYLIGLFTNSLGGPINEFVVALRNQSMTLLPIAIAVAILRYRLYDIDLIIRKTVQYGVLSALLALAYFGSVVLLQAVVGQATDAQSPLVIVVSTLLIAALFAPLRKRVQTAVDRRFYRQKYDAQQVLAQFAVVARDETDMDKLTAELTRVVQETMRPESMVVWFKTVERKVSHE